jgi:hypothetical protein
MPITLKMIKPQTRCDINTAAILLIGWSIAIGIYLAADGTVADPLAEFEDTKKYSYELERIGGKAALAANYLTKWFSGLWQGESFAYTVAFITFAIAVGYYFVTAAGTEASE